jgi:hypothetical protein
MKRTQSLDGEVLQLRAPPRWWDVGAVVLYLGPLYLPSVPRWCQVIVVLCFWLHVLLRGSELWRVTIGHHRVTLDERLTFRWRTRADLALDEIAHVEISGRAMHIKTHEGQVVTVLRGMKTRDIKRVARDLSERAARHAVPDGQAVETERQRRAVEALTRQCT